MRIMVDEVVKNIKYTRSTFDKILTNNGISNHFELNEEDLLKLHSLPIHNGHSRSLRNYLDDLIKNKDTKENVKSKNASIWTKSLFNLFVSSEQKN